MPGLGSVTEYSQRDLVALIRWIESDTLLRTEDDLIGEALVARGFQKRGKNIVTAIKAGIAAARRGRPRPSVDRHGIP